MADGEHVERSADSNGIGAHTDLDPRVNGIEEDKSKEYVSLAGDKEELDYKKDFKEIKVARVPDQVPTNVDDSNTSANHEDHDDGGNLHSPEKLQQKSPVPEREGVQDGQAQEDSQEGSTSPVPPPPPDKDDPNGPPPTSNSMGTLPSAATSGEESQQRARSDSASTQATSSTKRSSVPLSSIVFVASALDQIAASKEARGKGKLREAVQQAVDAVKRPDGFPNPEIIFEPLRLATETTNIPLTTTALDCIGKLISYSYFSIPAEPPDPNAPPEQQQQLPLIDRAIETICDCFQNEATPFEVQLQIVKSLLAAVLNDKLIVHGSGLLKAVRQVYNIFLLSKSNTNQQVAQGTLTQMVGTVFERLSTRLAMKEARSNLVKSGSDKDTVNSSQIDIDTSAPHLESTEANGSTAQDGASEVNLAAGLGQPLEKELGEKLTLQSLENAKIFDDRKIGDNAPTMVTPAKMSKALQTASGQPTAINGDDIISRPDTPYEDEEDEIYVKDAFLVFRSMCRLSHKELAPLEQQDIHSSSMRSKLVSLAIIRTTLNNHMAVFTSPLCTIRGTNNEPTSFGQAINQYLRLSVSRNGASSVRRVFETCAEIFWLMLKDMRVMLKVCCPEHL